MINIFICTEIIMEHIFVDFIQNMVVFIQKNQIKMDFPTTRLNIAPCAERADWIAKPAHGRHTHWKTV